MDRSGSENPHNSLKRTLEVLSFWHLLLYAIMCTWMLGGSIYWATEPLKIWGSAGILLFFPNLILRLLRHRHYAHIAWLIAPIFLFNLFVWIGAHNPNQRELMVAGQTAFVRGGDLRWLPSSARGDLSINALWLFDGLYLSCLNFYLCCRRRSSIKALLIVLITNGLILSILGSVQKLSDSAGPYFGRIKSPNKLFFSTFLYHNHWGPHVLLLLVSCIGLAWAFFAKSSRRYRDFWHSPGFLFLITAFLLCATIPLSGSRLCTMLMLLLLGAAFLHWAKKIQRENAGRFWTRGRRFIVLTAAVIGIGAITWNAYPVIKTRGDLALQQISGTLKGTSPDGRIVLYRDVITMASNRPVFGWGMASFPIVFYSFNTQYGIDVRYNAHFYEDAHSDILQSFAEHGVVGSVLLGLLVLVPLYQSRAALRSCILSQYLLFGCSLVALLSAVEFPFACPAVVLIWWICFLCALRLAKLELTNKSECSP
jgi:O-antigen ligase